MDTFQSIKCLIGLHNYHIHKEESLLNIKGEVIGNVIVCRCCHCGRIKQYRVYTTNYYRYEG